jgi:ABC-type multidrug transport system fused ATPase/permease subunit
MLSVEIYRKSLRRRDLSSAEKDTTTGSIVNLMSTDATRVSEFSSLWFSSIGAPVELAIGSYFLYQLIGIASLLGLLVMVLVLPINHLNSKIFAKTQDRLMQARDKRVSLMSELLQGIRQIKFFAWEKKWEERIMDARKVELKHLGITYINSIFFSFVWQG